MQIHLLSVQPAVSRHVALFFARGELGALHHEAAIEELAPARALLDAAGVPYAASHVVGRQAATIVHHAREIGCDRILLGEENGSGSAGAHFGRLAPQIRQMAGSCGCVWFSSGVWGLAVLS